MVVFKQTLKTFKFDQYKLETTKDSLDAFRQRSPALLPQALAWIGSNIRLVKGESGKWSFDKTFDNLGSEVQSGKLLFEGSPVSGAWLLGMFRALNHHPRGEILSPQLKQSQPSGSRYAANIPLILSAFKQYRNVNYEDWDWDSPSEHLKWFLDKDNRDVIAYRKQEMPWTLEQLEEFRIQTNTKEKALTAITSVVRIADPDFKMLPRLLKLMLLQLWTYHPSIRHPLAITNLQNFDEPAKPLVDSELQTSLSAFGVKQGTQVVSKFNETEPLPWGLS